jgi:hypothetical protein
MGYFDERNEAIKRATDAHEGAQEGQDGRHLRTGSIGLPGVHGVPGGSGRFHQPEPDTVVKTTGMVAATEQKIILEAMRKL